MTTQEALDRALEALREIKSIYQNLGQPFDMHEVARKSLNEIQRGLWIEEVGRPPEIHMALRISREVFRELWGCDP